MSVGKASIRRAANAGARKSAAARTGAAEAAKAAEITKTGVTNAGKASDQVVQSVISPMNADLLQAKFLSGNLKDSGEDTGKPVRLTENLPNYLL